MKKNVRQQVFDELFSCVERTVQRVDKSIEKDLESGSSFKPFHEKILTPEINKLSKFERSFSTSLGQSVLEKISKIIALGVDGTEASETQKKTTIKLSEKLSRQIDYHIEKIRNGTDSYNPEWEKDLKSFKLDRGTKIDQRVISDLWFKRNGLEYFFSIKTVKPNLDQTGEAKRDMLKLKLFNGNFEPYFALPYNPYGEKRELYDHKFPSAFFDMHKSPCVLIGVDYWDFIGGKGTYKELLKIIRLVGKDSNKLLKKWQC